MTRDRLELTAGLLVLSLPLAAFGYLLANPHLDRTLVVPTEHFYIVSAASLLALALAILVGAASVASRQPRVFCTAAAFLAVAGIFAVHGLTTPGVLVHHPYHALTVSPRLSLLVGGLLFALGTVEPPERAARFIERHHGALMAAVAGLVLLYLCGNLLHEHLLDWIPVGDPAVDYGTALAAGAALLFAAWRHYQVFSISRLPVAAAFSVGLVLLAESLVSMTFGPVYRLSWWEYHVLMLLGFLVPMLGIGYEYVRGRQLKGIVEGLFLRDVLTKLEQSLPEAVGALVAATEVKDPYLRGHAQRVCRLAVLIGRELHLPDSQLRAVAAAALLHDVGKIGIPDAVLQKPGALDPQEFAELKHHTTRGYHITAQIPSLGRRVADAVKYHHERLDGSGYPDGLQGDQIPLEARIVAVADVYDALTSDRVYRAAWSRDAALRQIQQEAGERLDARCVQALLDILARGEDLSEAAALPLVELTPQQRWAA
ncbi:MAG TPA: HD-GYP domain-containing protein [Dehalococcoidia bacterium]